MSSHLPHFSCLLVVEKGFKMFYVILVHSTYIHASLLLPWIFFIPPLVFRYFILTKETFSHETKYLLCVQFILISEFQNFSCCFCFSLLLFSGVFMYFLGNNILTFCNRKSELNECRNCRVKKKKKQNENISLPFCLHFYVFLWKAHKLIRFIFISVRDESIVWRRDDFTSCSSSVHIS
jgi:hypothetical protein